MTGPEFSDQFDVLFNNITSNQAPGLNEYEKAVFLTKAQDELVKNYFLPQSNPKQAGFDDNQKRQMDFSLLMNTHGATPIEGASTAGAGDYDPMDRGADVYDPRGRLFKMPSDLFIPINESLRFVVKTESGYHGSNTYYTTKFQRQVIPLSMEEYTRQMSKPYKEPLKYQAWRLLVNNVIRSLDGSEDGKLAEIIAGHNDLKWLNAATDETRLMQYVIRYIRKPKPIIIAPIDSYNVSVNGQDGTDSDYYTQDADGNIINPCELDESLHEEILQRAVELAKIAWAGEPAATVQAGQRSE